MRPYAVGEGLVAQEEMDLDRTVELLQRARRRPR